MGWLKFMGFDFTPYKSVSAWTDRCLGRPAAVKTNAPE
jgi:glutathione S-transferase